MSLWGISSGGRWLAAWGVLAWSLALAGCVPAPPAQFQFNRLYAQQKVGQSETYPPQRAQEITDALYAMFGTPDEPFLPAESLSPVNDVIDRGLLKFAAGPTKYYGGITTGGLYRQHCVHCHGITGDGQGPTALYLNPYPRDYRPGVYKFKSTPKGYMPTHEDLKKVVVDGIPGTAMPSFKLLSNDEVEALVNYVKYLSLRGMTERAMIEMAATISGVDDPATPEDEYEKLAPDAAGYVTTYYAEAVEKWRLAETSSTPVPGKPEWTTKEQRAAAIAKGQQFFYGAGACYTCHGDTQLGDGNPNLYDDWSKYLSPAENKQGIDGYLSLGAFPPRPIPPRNLRAGVYRGGRRPIDLYWRIKNGIDGSGMPAAPYRGEGAPEDPKTLSDENIWQLIEFVKSLPYEQISDPFNEKNQPHYQRPRN